MKCLKCGKRIIETKCNTCGFDHRIEKFCLFSAFDIKIITSITRFMKADCLNDLENKTNSSNKKKRTVPQKFDFSPIEEPFFLGERLTSVEKRPDPPKLSLKPATDKTVISGESSSTDKIAIGSTFLFGSYPQSSSGIDKTPIEWIVLDEKDDELLLISKYVLDVQKYNRFDNEVSWAESSLRDWLNVSFLHSAFSSEERANIIGTSIQSERVLINGTVEEHQSIDKVFLLSAKEVDQYFATKMTSGYKRTFASDYADSKKVNIRESGCIWWLRSPGAIIRSIGDNVFNDGPDYRRAAIVSAEGSVARAGLTIWFDKGVRPALWLKKHVEHWKQSERGAQTATILNDQIEQILNDSINGKWPGPKTSSNIEYRKTQLRNIRTRYDSLNDSEKRLVRYIAFLGKLEDSLN